MDNLSADAGYSGIEVAEHADADRFSGLAG